MVIGLVLAVGESIAASHRGGRRWDQPSLVSFEKKGDREQRITLDSFLTIVIEISENADHRSISLFPQEKRMKTIRLEEMNWPDIKTAIAGGMKTVLVAVGSTEQHGPHLPTMTDALIGDVVAERVAAKLGNALVGRTISVGCSEHHLAFPGTISLKSATLKMVINDYIDSLLRSGFKKIVFVPSHGGNFAPVRDAIDEARRRHPDADITGFTDLMRFIKIFYDASAEFGISEEESGGHAGESETSIMMALRGHLIPLDRLAPGYIGPAGERELKIIFEQGMPALTQNGILGDPRKATAEKGEAYLKKLVNCLVEEIT